LPEDLLPGGNTEIGEKICDGVMIMRSEVLIQDSFFSSPTPTVPSHPFGPLSIKAWDMEDPPESKCLVADLLHEKTINLVDGLGSSGKSILMKQLGISVASGANWLGFPVLIQGPVLYLDAEDPDLENHRRYKKIRKSLRLSKEQNKLLISNLHYACLSELDIDPALIDQFHKTTHTYNELKKLVNAIKPVLIILDPLVYFTDADENSTVAAKALYSALRRLDTTIICVHHMSKSAMNGATSQRAKSRGSSVFTENARTRMSLENGILTIDKNNFGRKYEGTDALYLEMGDGAWRMMGTIANSWRLSRPKSKQKW